MRVDVSDLDQPCSCKKEHKIAVREVVIEAGAVNRLWELMESGFLRKYIHPVIICDTNTYEATEEILENIYDRCEMIMLDAKGLHADNRAVEIIRANRVEDMDLILAVGAGTIHDLSRYIAHEEGIPFVSIPTAASVDGFVSTVAAMTWHGLKKTMPAVAPVCVIADTNIFANAPKRLNASGMSDLLGKYICLADWKIAHLVTDEYICERVIKMEEKALREVKGCAHGVAEGDADACEKLMYALLMSGLAMQMIGNSRPASCAEHHISHLWEMEVINDHVDALHGEKVSVGTILSLREYKRIAGAIREGRCEVVPYEGIETELLEHTFGKKGLLEGVLMENTPDPLEQVFAENLEESLEEIADIIERLPDEDELLRLMEQAGCVHSVEEIGLSKDIVPLTLDLSPYVRNRLSLMRMRKLIQTHSSIAENQRIEKTRKEEKHESRNGL